MALWTAEQLQRVRAIIDRYHAVIALAVFGKEALPPDLVKDMQAAGVDIPAGPALIDDPFAYGKLLAILRDPKLAQFTVSEIAQLVADRKVPLALTPAEKASVDVAKKHAGQYAVGLGTRVAGQVMSAVTGAEADLTPDEIVEVIRDKTAANRRRRETIEQLKSDLGHSLGNWTRDWQRIAMTETNNAIQNGNASVIEQDYGADAVVSRIPRPDACADCKAMFLDADGDPIMFRLSELRANGSNVGRKREAWKPTIEAVHPWCGCTLVRVPAGMVWKDGELRVAATPDDDDEPQDQRDANVVRGVRAALEDAAKSEDVVKALFIGPRGGKWADAEHTIPYSAETHGGFKWARPEHEDELQAAAKHGFVPRARLDPVWEVLRRKSGQPPTYKLDVHVPAEVEDHVGGVQLKHRDEGKFTLIHRSPKPGYKKWQVTWFDKDGPVGDTSRGTLQEAVDYARQNGYALDHVEKVDVKKSADDFFDDLVKGATHKYLRRIPTGDAQRPYRYIYAVASGGKYIGDEREFHVGAKFRLADGPAAGHYEIVAIDGADITVKHDETGRAEKMPAAGLARALRAEYMAGIVAHEIKLKADLAAAMRFGSPKQRAMLEAEARRYGVALEDYFASGSNHRGEIQGFAQLGWNVGVAAPELSDDAEAELLKLAGTKTKVFVDSGAFSEVDFNYPAKKANPKKGIKVGDLPYPHQPIGPVVKAPITDEEWGRRLDLYDRLADKLGGQLYAVAPDKVAFQDDTLARLTKYAARVRALKAKGANILVPIQKGRRSMAQFDWEAQTILGTDDFVRAIPMKKDATSTEELRAYLEAVKPKRVHLLGLGPESERYPEVSAMLREIAPTTVVTLDSVKITAAVGRDGKGGKPRKLTAAQDRVRLRMIPSIWNEPVGDGLDYTDNIGTPSSWMGAADLKRAADEMQLDGESRTSWLKNPDAWLQEKFNGETKRYEHPVVQLALDNAWARFTVGEMAAKNGKPELRGGSPTVGQRKREGIVEAFGTKGPAPMQTREQAIAGAQARLEAARKQGKAAIQRALDLLEDAEVEHRYEVAGALKTGELSAKEFGRLHGAAYGPIEAFKRDPAHNFRYAGQTAGAAE